MDIAAMLMNSLWTALFAAALGVLLTTVPRGVLPCFFCGFAARFVRELFTAWGLTQNWATVIAAAVVVWLATVLFRSEKASPVVLVSGVIPLGASIPMFNVMTGLLQLSSLKGDAVPGAAVGLVANVSKVFTTSLAIAVGLAAGILTVRLFRGEETEAEG